MKKLDKIEKSKEGQNESTKMNKIEKEKKLKN